MAKKVEKSLRLLKIFFCLMIVVTLFNFSGLPGNHKHSELRESDDYWEMVKARLAPVKPLHSFSLNRNALHQAVLDGDMKKVQITLNKMNVNVNERDALGMTPLYLAAGMGDDSIVEYLLNHGANVSMTEKNGLSPLHIAAQLGGWKIVLSLLNHGANPNSTNETASHILPLALSRDEKVALLLLLAGADPVDKKHRQLPATYLYMVSFNAPRAVSALLQWGVPPRISGDYSTVLHHVACRGTPQMASLLVHLGALRFSSDTTNGYSPSYRANLCGNLLMARVLKNDAFPIVPYAYYVAPEELDRTVDALLPQLKKEKLFIPFVNRKPPKWTRLDESVLE